MSNPGFLSKRVKKKVTSGLTSDRYQFLGLDQAEPDLGDPLVGPSSVGVKPYTGSLSNLYVLVADNTGSGNRFWTQQSNIVSGGVVTPGSVTIRNKGSIVGSANQITDLNFVGSGVTVVNPATWVGAGSSSVDINIAVTDLVATGTVGAIQYKNLSGFVVGASDLFYTPSNTFVGIGSTTPTVKLDVIGNIKVSGIATIGTLQINSGIVTASSGILTYYGDGSKLSNIAVSYATIAGVSTNVIGGIASVTSLNVSGISTLGVTSTTNLTSQQLNVSGVTTLGILTVGNIYSTGIITATTFSGSFSGNVTTASYATSAGVSTNVIGGIASVTQLSVSGVSTFNNNVFIPSSSVGIGTTNPLQRLQVGTANTLGINTTGTVFVVTSNADVGIGTTNPITKLDVRGNVNISGVITASSFTGNLVGIATTATTAITALGLSTTASVNTTGIITASSFIGNLVGIATTAITALGLSTTASVNTTGIITSSQFSTGSSGIGINTDTISGPAVMYIDPSPAGVGTTSGIVRIRGDLYVDGTQFIVNSTTIELADFNVGIATTVGTDLLLDGAGIGIGSINIRKTFTYNNSTNTLESSIGLGVTSGGAFKTGTSNVLTSTTLGSGVVNSSLTSVGTLGQLNVTGIVTVGVGNTVIKIDGTTGVVTATKYFGDGSALTGINTTNTAGYASTAGIASSVVGGIASVTQLYVSGISTFNNGPVLVGTTTSTGTSSQRLQVAGGAYISGNLGIGTTNPSTPLSVENYGVKTGFGTFIASAGISTDVDSFTIVDTNFQTAEYTVHIQSSSSVQAQKVLVMQNGTSAFSQEYAIMYDPTYILSISATVSGGLCKLQFTPESGISGLMTYRFTRETIMK